MDNVEVKVKPLWRAVVAYSLASATMLALEKAVDSTVTNEFLLTGVDPLTRASSYILVGGWFGVLVAIIIGLVFGNKLHWIDPINLNQPEMYPWVIKAGAAAAGFTIVFLVGLQFLDLQLMYALTAPYLLFVILTEWKTGAIKNWRTFVIPGGFVVIGSVVTTYDPNWIRGNITDVGTYVLIAVGIFLVYNYLFAQDELLQKPAADVADPTNVQLLRAIVLAVTATIGVSIFALVRGQWDALMYASKYLIENPNALLALGLLFVFVTFGVIFKLMAKKRSANVSPVVLVVAAHLVIGLFLSYKLNEIMPGAAGYLPEWGGPVFNVRIVGVVMLAIGISWLLFKHDKDTRELVKSLVTSVRRVMGRNS